MITTCMLVTSGTASIGRSRAERRPKMVKSTAATRTTGRFFNDHSNDGEEPHHQSSSPIVPLSSALFTAKGPFDDDLLAFAYSGEHLDLAHGFGPRVRSRRSKPSPSFTKATGFPAPALSRSPAARAHSPSPSAPVTAIVVVPKKPTRKRERPVLQSNTGGEGACASGIHLLADVFDLPVKRGFARAFTRTSTSALSRCGSLPSRRRGPETTRRRGRRSPRSPVPQ